MLDHNELSTAARHSRRAYITEVAVVGVAPAYFWGPKWSLRSESIMTSMVSQVNESKGSAPLEMRWGLPVNESPSAFVAQQAAPTKSPYSLGAGRDW
jgi:hypothetical protein